MKISVPENLRNYKLIDTSVFTKGKCIIVQSAYELDPSKFNNCDVCNTPIINKRSGSKTCSDYCRVKKCLLKKKLSLKKEKV